jgi:hypothetical protein
LEGGQHSALVKTWEVFRRFCHNSLLRDKLLMVRPSPTLPLRKILDVDFETRGPGDFHSYAAYTATKQPLWVAPGRNSPDGTRAPDREYRSGARCAERRSFSSALQRRRRSGPVAPRRRPREPSYEYSRGPRYRSAARHPSDHCPQPGGSIPLSATVTRHASADAYRPRPGLSISTP